MNADEDQGSIRFRRIDVYEELKEIARLQGEHWPPDFWTPAEQMKAAVMHGGSVIAAFDGDRPVGFCYGFAAFDGRRRYFHSHLAVIRAEYRDRGIGMRLKAEQRRWALEYGYDTITWTYDPFQLRNAHLNLHKLGGTVRDYFRGVYGTDAAGDPSDRFLIRWELNSPRVIAALEGKTPWDARWPEYPVWLAPDGGMSAGTDAAAFAAAGDAPSAAAGAAVSAAGGGDGVFHEPGLLLAVPKQAAELKVARPEAAIRWKLALRAKCEEAFRRGYRVVGVLPGDERCSYYVLEKDQPMEAPCR